MIISHKVLKKKNLKERTARMKHDTRHEMNPDKTTTLEPNSDEMTIMERRDAHLRSEQRKDAYQRSDFRERQLPQRRTSTRQYEKQ